MRDVALLVILIAFCALALSRPWFGVVGLALLGAMHPQSYGDWASRFPVYKVMFAVTCIAVALDGWRSRQWPRLFWDWRLSVLALLLADFAMTSYFALLPTPPAGH